MPNNPRIDQSMSYTDAYAFLHKTLLRFPRARRFMESQVDIIQKSPDAVFTLATKAEPLNK